MKIAVASGKGGTGKTTVAVNLSAFLSMMGQSVQLLDCDVEEPNCHLFLPLTFEEREACNISVPQIREDQCTHCGLCAKACAFHAIIESPRKVLFMPELCHGCGACAYACPQGCIDEVPRTIGFIEKGTANVFGNRVKLMQGVLNVGEALSAVVVKSCRRKALSEHASDVTVIDSPPGTSCSMVQSISAADMCLLVTEPTPFGLHDLKLAWETAAKLGVPSAVILNRSDIGDNKVDEFCKENRIPIILRIPTDRELAALYAQGKLLVIASEKYSDMFAVLFYKIREFLKTKKEDVPLG